MVDYTEILIPFIFYDYKRLLLRIKCQRIYTERTNGKFRFNKIKPKQWLEILFNYVLNFFLQLKWLLLYKR